MKQSSIQKHSKKRDKPGRKADSQLLNRIHEVLNEMPFASSYVIADILNEKQSTVYRYLTNRLGLVYKQSLGSVPAYPINSTK